MNHHGRRKWYGLFVLIGVAAITLGQFRNTDGPSENVLLHRVGAPHVELSSSGWVTPLSHTIRRVLQLR